MKAKFYTVIISALFFAAAPAIAQYGDDDYYYNDDAAIIVNNYYTDYDFYWSSRINRFHRYYTVFDYYSPVFTDVYWYSSNPFTWGISIYGGSPGFSIIYGTYYPVYYGYDYGWYNPYYYDPYYYGSGYWGYNPWYTRYWYNPFVFNFNFNLGYRWHNYYRAWNRFDYWHNDYRWHNYYRHSYGSRNNYYYSENTSTRYSSRNSPSAYSSRRTEAGSYVNPESNSRRGSTGNLSANSSGTQSVQRHYTEIRVPETRSTRQVSTERRQVAERSPIQSSNRGRSNLQSQGHMERRSVSPVMNSGSAGRRSPVVMSNQGSRSIYQTNNSSRRQAAPALSRSGISGNPGMAPRTSSIHRSSATRQSRPSPMRSAITASPGRHASTHRVSAAPQSRSSSNSSGSRSGSSGSSRSGRR